ncbi:REV3L [Cordylochernes scorpioides]|uniref:DNA-directed DNA polymerase n=1 Tax=Cordylochernes scorpioides TaxID=51811 RepID=A0ABY6KR90_9ARAC|nr:REV3L [Cordylochernes scorpioides]
MVCAVPCGIHDAEVHQAARHGGSESKPQSKSFHVGPRGYPTGDGAQSPGVLPRPCGGAGLPVPLPLHHHCLQLLLLHLSGPAGLPPPTQPVSCPRVQPPPRLTGLCRADAIKFGCSSLNVPSQLLKVTSGPVTSQVLTAVWWQLGESIVGKARQTLERAIKFVNSMHKWKAKVVYGDTDSLFVHLPGRTREEAFRIGQQIADAVTSQNPRPVKLKFEKVS